MFNMKLWLQVGACILLFKCWRSAPEQDTEALICTPPLSCTHKKPSWCSYREASLSCQVVVCVNQWFSLAPQKEEKAPRWTSVVPEGTLSCINHMTQSYRAIFLRRNPLRTTSANPRQLLKCWWCFILICNEGNRHIATCWWSNSCIVTL